MTKTGWGFGISVIVICVIFVICDLEFLVTLVLQNSWQSLPLCGLYPVPTTHGRVQSTVHAKGNDLTFIVYEGHGHIGIFPLFWIILIVTNLLQGCSAPSDLGFALCRPEKA
jgi:hypothetical protein